MYCQAQGSLRKLVHILRPKRQSHWLADLTRKSRLCLLSEDSLKDFVCRIHWQKVLVMNVPLGGQHCRGHKINRCPLTYVLDHPLLTEMHSAEVHNMEIRYSVLSGKQLFFQHLCGSCVLSDCCVCLYAVMYLHFTDSKKHKWRSHLL